MNYIQEPKLSIIVLTYNRSNLLRDCLQSLIKQDMDLQQIELVVADDGSTDDTHRVVEEFQRTHPRLLYVRHLHKGIPATRNLGIRHASGPLIAIVADDYILAPDYARTIIRFFDENLDAEIVRFRITAAQDDIFSRVSHFYYEVSFLNRLLPAPELKGKKAYFKRFFAKLPSPTMEITTEHELEAAGAAAFRISVIHKVGLFDERLLRGEDTDYTRRVKALGISVYYNPFHEVRHQYSWGCLDTIQKSFIHGANYYRLYHKHADTPSAVRQIKTASRALVHQFLQAFWRARQVSRRREFVLFFPVLLAFEISVKAGMCWGFLQFHRSRNRIKENQD